MANYEKIQGKVYATNAAIDVDARVKQIDVDISEMSKNISDLQAEKAQLLSVK